MQFGKVGSAAEVSNSPESCSWEGGQSGQCDQLPYSILASPPLFILPNLKTQGSNSRASLEQRGRR